MADIGKEAEARIKTWLDRPDEGYSLDRLVDQMSGFYGSKNICDFILFKSPNQYYLESKATWSDRFEFAMLTQYQYDGMREKSKIAGVTCYVVVLFVTYKRAFLIDIQDIEYLKENTRTRSLNIKKINKWPCKYLEIKTIPSRKQLLDYAHEDNVL